MKSLGTLLIAAVIAVVLGTVGAFAMVSSIDGSQRNSDKTAADQAADRAKECRYMEATVLAAAGKAQEAAELAQRAADAE